MSGLDWSGPRKEEVGSFQLADGSSEKLTNLGRMVDAPGPSADSAELLVERDRAVSGSALIGSFLGFISHLTLLSLASPLGPQAFPASRETSNPKMISDRLPSIPLSLFLSTTAPPLINFPDSWWRSDRIYPDAQKYLLPIVQQNVQS